MIESRLSQETRLEQVACPLCGSHQARVLHRPQARLPYVVNRCEQCAMDYLSPRLTEAAMLAHYRSDAYFDGAGYQDYAAQAQALRATFARLLRHLAEMGIHGGRLLEVGCGHGYLLEQAAEHFSYRCGTDYSNAALEVAAPHADRLCCGGVAELPSEEADFDCVIANHVIEHVYEPQEFVRRLLARLRPGGVLVLSTPDAGSLWRVVMGRYWPSYKLPEHIHFFDRHSLSRLMASCGVQGLQSVPYPHAFPLSLVAAKVGLTLTQPWAQGALWLPGTTVAVMGRREQ